MAELARCGDGGKVIAGGQSLVPAMAMRLARPSVLVDINGIAELSRIERGAGYATIGATVRQREVEHDPVSAEVPLLGMALPWVGHRELRSRGTVCGSLAHADPAAELPAVACCLDASLTLAGPSGERCVAARDFFAGAMMTQLGPGEVLTAVRFPLARTGDGFGFGEIARRHGDFALAGVAVYARGGRVTLTGFGISDRPVTHTTAQGEISPDVLDAMVDTDGDAHASRDYRRRLFRVLADREIAQATGKAGT